MYDFDREVNRRNTDSLKWDVGADELPLWVADMDFETAPEVKEAIIKRAEHGVFGYNIIPDEWNTAYIKWWKMRHKLEIEKEWLIFSTGVIPIISSAVRKLTTPGENVLVQTPVYNIFFNSIVNNGCNVLKNELLYDNGVYSIDFDDLEQKLKNPQTTLMILCNPHNPVGKIWDRDTLKNIGELCFKYHVVVISDEIHCDMTAPGLDYVPFADVSEKCRDNSITCLAPTKTFNIAGLQTAAAMVPNENLRNKINRALNTDEVAEPNSFAIAAAVAAFDKGGPWLDECKKYIQSNKDYVVQFLKNELPQISVVSTDATYLLWLDCIKVTASEIKSGGKLEKVNFAGYLRDKTGLFLSDGEGYGAGRGSFLRMNTACTRATLEEGLRRLKTGTEMLQQ